METDDIVNALQDVESAVREVEKAVKEKGNNWWGTLFGILVAVWVVSLPSDIWHSKWRYSLSYNVPSSKVIVQSKPHNCAFFAAPIGEKYCHYDRDVSTVEWATSTTGQPIISTDEGKTWSVFDPDPAVKVPSTPTVEEVDISWEKKEED